jgi:hypothetical protein
MDDLRVEMEGPQPQQYPVQQPPQAYMGIPPKKGYIFLITMGIVILLLGGMVMASAGFLREPDQDDYADNPEGYEDDVDGYRYLQRLIPSIGQIIQFVGLIVFSMGMLTGALTDMELPPMIRVGMLIALAIIIGFKISGTTIYYWF